jgi:hypothetical protein
MLDQPMLRDISIASQKKRRLLVTATYTVLLAFAAVIVTKPSWVGRGSVLHLLLLIIVGPLLGLVPLLFFYLAKLPIPGSFSGEMTRLTLRPGPRDPDDPDERQVAIRNAAHYQAFRFLIFYCSVFCVAFLFLNDLNSATVHRLMMALALLLLFVVWTLPPAIVLWTEPDIPEEARV